MAPISIMLSAHDPDTKDDRSFACHHVIPLIVICCVVGAVTSAFRQNTRNDTMLPFTIYTGAGVFSALARQRCKDYSSKVV
ncbi:hypothetical protein EDB89DRAFT_200248 [Lactarius sanguifluus]|nr:hypothetical protein EDB89DRAFT_200248 [Lactarius sanguifluus]